MNRRGDPVFDRLDDALAAVETMLQAQRFSRPAYMELPSGELLGFKKCNGGWRLVIHRDRRG